MLASETWDNYDKSLEMSDKLLHLRHFLDVHVVVEHVEEGQLISNLEILHPSLDLDIFSKSAKCWTFTINIKAIQQLQSMKFGIIQGVP